MACRDGTGARQLEPFAVALAIGNSPPAGTTTAEWVAKSREESRHRPECVNEIGAVGLLQVRDIHWETAPWNPPSKAAYRDHLKNPQRNISEGFRLYNESLARTGNGWQPWAASGGRPTPNAQDNEAAGAYPEGGIDIPNPLDVADDVAGAIGQIGQVFAEIGSWVVKGAQWLATPQNWVRIAEVGGGFVLVAAAVSVLARPVIESEVGSSIKGKIPSS